MNILKNNRGVTLVFIALFLFLLLAFIGLAVDVGWTTYVRSQGQARVDAAALDQTSGLVVALGQPQKHQELADTQRALHEFGRGDEELGFGRQDPVWSRNASRSMAARKA